MQRDPRERQRGEARRGQASVERHDGAGLKRQAVATGSQLAPEEARREPRLPAVRSQIVDLEPEIVAQRRTQGAVEAQLAICESSDWFWWFGDYHPSVAVASFDNLYRRNLARLYDLLQLQPPAHLDTPICAGSESASGGTMLRATHENAN